MTRRYTALDLVQLPKLDALAAEALGTELLSAAGKPEKLPDAVREAVDDLRLALEGLRKASAGRRPGTAGPDPARSKAAEITLEATWSGLLDWLNGWAKIPNVPEAEIAMSLRDKLFPEGLRFILLRHKLEWAECNIRLLLIDDEGLASEFKKLGGENILQRLWRAHGAYGVAFGVAEPSRVEASDMTTLRQVLDGFGEALRKLVVQAAAMVRKNDPMTAEISNMLLAPLLQWEAIAAKRGEPGREEASAAPDKLTESPSKG